MSAIAEFGFLTKGFAVEAIRLYFEPIAQALERLRLSSALGSSQKIARRYMRELDKVIGKIHGPAPSLLLVENFRLLSSALKQFSIVQGEQDVHRREITIMLFVAAQLNLSQSFFSQTTDATYWSHRLENERPEAWLSSVAAIFSILGEFYRVEREPENAEVALLASARLYQHLADPRFEPDFAMRMNAPALYSKEASRVLRRLAELYVQRAEDLRSTADAMAESAHEPERWPSKG